MQPWFLRSGSSLDILGGSSGKCRPHAVGLCSYDGTDVDVGVSQLSIGRTQQRKDVPLKIRP